VSVSKPKSQPARKITRSKQQLNEKSSKLKKRDYIVGDPEDFVHMDWSSEWSELKNLQPLPDGRGSE
jgi:hypothetical protein